MLKTIDYLKTLKTMHKCGCGGNKKPSVIIKKPRK